jgi:hypothetical protein
MSAFENRVLKKIFGRKGITEECILVSFSLFSLPNIREHEVHVEGKINACRVTLWKLEETRPLEKYTRRYDNNINWILRTVNSMRWHKMIKMLQDRNEGREFGKRSSDPLGYIKFGEFIK